MAQCQNESRKGHREPWSETGSWQQELARAFTAVEPLLGFLGLSPEQVPGLDQQPGPFRLLVPRGFAALMHPGDALDPLLRQVLPLTREHHPVAGFRLDPVGDGPATSSPGLLRKYAGRALLMTHGGCAIHCRYCFRRHFPYTDLGAHGPRVRNGIDQLQADATLREVVLSGGDPLMLSDEALVPLLSRLSVIPHLRRLRLHSRLPVVLPSRITDRLCTLLGGLHLPVVVVIHANHARELGEAAHAGLKALSMAGVTLLNQSVLLSGVNDSADVLAELSERLFDCGVLPYYLHQLDRVQGAAHFAVPDPTALGLMDELRLRLPGYLVPRLVRELEGAPCKQPLG
jgi:EF-P beta-lysylation protein EpmB